MDDSINQHLLLIARTKPFSVETIRRVYDQVKSLDLTIRLADLALSENRNLLDVTADWRRGNMPIFPKPSPPKREYETTPLDLAGKLYAIVPQTQPPTNPPNWLEHLLLETISQNIPATIFEVERAYAALGSFEKVVDAAVRCSEQGIPFAIIVQRMQAMKKEA